LHYPSVIVHDEPLTGLDVESAMMTKDLLASLAASGKTVLYSSHVLDVVERFCDRVIIIDRGNLIADGSPEALKAQTHETSLEGVFRGLTNAATAEPRVASIIDALRSWIISPCIRSSLGVFGRSVWNRSSTSSCSVCSPL